MLSDPPKSKQGRTNLNIAANAFSPLWRRIERGRSWQAAREAQPEKAKTRRIGFLRGPASAILYLDPPLKVDIALTESVSQVACAFNLR